MLADIYADKKAHLRLIHDKVMQVMKGWGEFEIAPKKGYVSLRRKKQFAMLGPRTNDRVELGLNLQEDVASKKIVAQKPGGMCQFIAPLSGPAAVDKEILAALKNAFEAAGSEPLAQVRGHRPCFQINQRDRRYDWRSGSVGARCRQAQRPLPR